MNAGFIVDADNRYAVEQEAPELIQIQVDLAFDGRPAAIEAAREAGLDIDFRGLTLLESDQPPHHLLINLDHLWQASEPTALWLRDKVVDKATDVGIGIAIGAAGTKAREVLKRVPTLLRRFAVHAAPRRTIVSIRATGVEGERRWYPLQDEYPDEATLAILDDLGVPLTGVGNASPRTWKDGRWMGVADYFDWAETERAEGRDPD